MNDQFSPRIMQCTMCIHHKTYFAGNCRNITYRRYDKALREVWLKNCIKKKIITKNDVLQAIEFFMFHQTCFTFKLEIVKS